MGEAIELLSSKAAEEPSDRGANKGPRRGYDNASHWYVGGWVRHGDPLRQYPSHVIVSPVSLLSYYSRGH